MLSLGILGRFALTGPEGPVALPSAKLDALLAYLALALDPVPRDELRTLLWGSHFDAQADQNFRQALARLRKALGSNVVISDEQGVRLSEMAVRCDALEFQALAASPDQAALRTDVGLLAGELLAGVEIKEPAWEEWLETGRRRLSSLACDAMERLAHIDLNEGRPLDALRTAEECVRRNPYRESAHRLAMRAQIALGRRSEAPAHYQSLVQRLKQDLVATPEHETAKICQSARGAAPIIDRRPPDRNPSIVVLPFINHGGDADQDYFTDGIVEEITTALSRLRWLFVIACNTSFTYKRKAVDVKQVGLELGVQYVLEGGVRRAGERLRITAQLVGTETAMTLWADRFEGAVGDVFDLQDQVTSKVVAAIGPKLESVEIERSNRKPTADAYDHYLRGLAEVHRWNRQANQEALRQFYRSIELDRKFAAAYGVAARGFSQRKPARMVSKPAGSPTVLKARILKGVQQ